MSSPEVSHEPSPNDVPGDLVAVGCYPTFTAGSDRGLVVLATGRPYWLMPVEAGFALLVEPVNEAHVRRQLEKFERESIGWPPAPVRIESRFRPLDLAMALLWAVAVFAVFAAEQRWPAIVDAGLLDAARVFRAGEVWRAFTALFLHADSGHLVSNALSGVFVFSAVTATVGLRRGWLLILLGACAGNLASAAAQFPAPYHSLGASTAVFAALGILTGHAVRIAAARNARARWQAAIVPIGAGGTVLALYGAGNMRVDLGAHLCGFLAGCVLGFAASTKRSLRPIDGSTAAAPTKR